MLVNRQKVRLRQMRYDKDIAQFRICTGPNIASFALGDLALRRLEAFLTLVSGHFRPAQDNMLE
jgi:hypothetical protein